MSFSVQTSCVAAAPLSVGAYAPKEGASVGLAFSGGGTRASLAALGVLRALASLGPTASEKNYLSQLLAISSVSGGSWFAVTWTYLPVTFTDADFLGEFVADPALLTTHGRGGKDVTVLGNDAYSNVFNHYDFSLPGLTGRALALIGDVFCPDDRIWSVLIGENILAPFGLSSFHDGYKPTCFYTSTQSAGQVAQDDNPRLPDFYAMRVDAALPRPFLVCNGSQKVFVDGQEWLAPVHFTPWFAGLVAKDDGTDTHGARVGGGGVDTFAWAGTLTKLDKGQMTVSTSSALDLSDIAGVSSACFSQTLSKKLDSWLDPRYECFAADASSAPSGGVSTFADGGSLENTGIASLLAYGDIKSVVACVADSTGVTVSDTGNATQLPESIPPLFGMDPTLVDGIYKPWDCNSTDPRSNSKVFCNSDFVNVLEALAAASNNGSQATVALTTLNVVDNPWFAVTGGRTVQVLWLVLGQATAFNDLLSKEVQAVLPKEFPNYNLFDTERNPVESNMLAHFTGWLVSEAKVELASLF